MEVENIIGGMYEQEEEQEERLGEARENEEEDEEVEEEDEDENNGEDNSEEDEGGKHELIVSRLVAKSYKGLEYVYTIHTSRRGCWGSTSTARLWRSGSRYLVIPKWRKPAGSAGGGRGSVSDLRVFSSPPLSLSQVER